MIEKLIDFSLNTTDKPTTLITSPKNRAKSAFDRQRNTTGNFKTIKSRHEENRIVSGRGRDNLGSHPISPTGKELFNSLNQDDI